MARWCVTCTLLSCLSVVVNLCVICVLMYCVLFYGFMFVLFYRCACEVNVFGCAFMRDLLCGAV